MDERLRQRVFRVQDAEGRGPYRPGMSQHWVDSSGPPPPPTWMQEFGDIRHHCGPNECMGCGCRDLTQLAKWFTPTEQRRLEALGYQIVSMWVDRIVAESENQVVFVRRQPLHMGATRRAFHSACSSPEGK